MISNESIHAGDIEIALSSLEEATEMALKAYDDMKASGADKELLDSAKKEFCNIPLRCFHSVISNDDNTLTSEKRYKACKAKLDALGS